MGNKRRQFSLSFKLQAIDKWRLLDKNYTKTASFFKIDRKTLRAWINNEEQLRSHDGEKRYAKRVKRKKNLIKFPELERTVVEWIKSERTS